MVDHGTAAAAKLPLDGIQMAGKTGTAQTHNLSAGERGMTRFPVASRLAITASCSGLMRTMPWPIDMLTVSYPCHLR